MSVVFPSDPETWKTVILEGALQKALEEDFSAPPAPWFTEEHKKEFLDTFLEGGLLAPTRWYTINLNGMSDDDDKSGLFTINDCLRKHSYALYPSEIPQERLLPPTSAPLFFAGAKKDYICRIELVRMICEGDLLKEHEVTLHEFDSDHWIIMSHADELNKALEEWLETSVVPKTSF